MISFALTFGTLRSLVFSAPLYFLGMYHDTYKRPSSALPTAALPTTRLAPRELICTDCADRYCGSDELDQACCNMDLSNRHQRNYSPTPYRETMEYDESGADICCNDYANNTYVDSGQPSFSNVVSKNPKLAQTKRIAGYNNTPCDVTDPDAFSVIESYCDGDWTSMFCLH